jgi:thiamine pyrophosphate-dependent acetolactate synthase large subunit-like protein
LVAEAVTLLRGAARPLIMAGRVTRDPIAWSRRVALAEMLGAHVATDLKLGAAFPTDHKLHVAAPTTFALPEIARAIAKADVILSLDWVDLAGTLRAACGGAMPAAKVIQISLDHTLHNGWSMDHQGLPPVDLFLAAEPDIAVAAMLARLGHGDVAPVVETPIESTDAPPPGAIPPGAIPPGAIPPGAINVPMLAASLRRAVVGLRVSLLHLPISWDGAAWPFRHPLDFLGGDGGGGIGAGPGISVGAALALMGATSLWTAVHYRIPLLLIVANNRSFFNDELHQERVARMRGRPVENRWIGQRISDPDIDHAGLARAQGAAGFGPVTDAAELQAVFAQAVAVVQAGGVAVVDVQVTPGYAPAMTAAMTGAGSS